jgi:predicted transcriptional regulator
MNAEQVRKVLRKRAELLGSQAKLAREAKVSRAFVNDILMARREPSGRLLSYIGLKRQVRYVDIETP